jgi:predicted ATPase
MATTPSDDLDTDTDDGMDRKPPFLRRVRIRNYKSIAFCDVTLEPLTILVGRNASGKSNFLDALAFLRDAMRGGLSQALADHGGMGSLLCKSRDSQAFSIEIESPYFNPILGEEFLFEYILKVPLNSGDRLPDPIEQYQVTSRSDSQKNGFARQGKDLNLFGGRAHSEDGSVPGVPLEVIGDQLVLRQYGFHLDAADRYLPGELQRIGLYNFNPRTIRPPQKSNPGRLLDPDGGNLASVIRTTLKREPWYFERVGQYLAAITRTVELAGVESIGAYETIQFLVSRGEQLPPMKFDASAMSDGTLRALATLVAAFQSIQPDGDPSLIAIEEPETSLHPGAMNALVDALDEATLRMQVLVSTHSAEMLDNSTIRPENIRVVEMVDGQTLIGRVDEASVEIVKRHLATLGGLERDNHLEPDAEDLNRQKELAQGQPEKET